MIPLLPALFWVIVGQAQGSYPGQPRDLSIAPEFDPTPLTVSVMPGETALLPCRVRNLSDKVVSWMRRKDLLIISSGRFMFTADSRFQVISPDEDPASWNLQLRKAKPQDEGLYECQVNTDPKLKQAVLLTVSDKPDAMEMSLKDDSRAYGSEETTILGPKERYARVGSSLSITCHVSVRTGTTRGRQRPVRLVEWLHNDVPVLDRPGAIFAGVDTEKNGEELSSTLTVSNIIPQAAGKYTCKPYLSGKSASVLVNILEGERTEAMKGQSSAASFDKPRPTMLLIHLSVFGVLGKLHVLH
ncbi:kin of IRRE-like protein 1 isoform X2 [Halyomorpha halys]|uniref:kin of IRRE-like protein 1 isoform X2 n=1 Tax=Halyomorpha halys TaxID=286706 RepID=UPI0006D5015E|nr:hemicentin-1-like isoform X2 [Halyomorpha halys]